MPTYNKKFRLCWQDSEGMHSTGYMYTLSQVSTELEKLNRRDKNMIAWCEEEPDEVQE